MEGLREKGYHPYPIGQVRSSGVVSPVRGLWSLASSFPHLLSSESVNPAMGSGGDSSGWHVSENEPTQT